MKIKININRCFTGLCFFICLIYILMRPVLVTYVSGLFKYLFILVMTAAAIWGLAHKSIFKKVGKTEFFLCCFFSLYVIITSLWFGDLELFYYGIERYIFLMTPLFAIPIVARKVNWVIILYGLTIFGIIDASVSIYEFITHSPLFASANVAESVLIQMSSYKIIRTYGLNGNYFLLAEILCVCGFAAYYLFKFHRSKFGGVSLIIITVGIFTTGSRGYYVAFIFGLLLLYFSDVKRKNLGNKKIKKLIFVAISLIIGLWFLIGTDITFGIPNIDTILKRIRQIFMWQGEDANEARLRTWQWALEQWKSNLLIGNGPCSTDTRYSKYISVTESGVLKRLVELGIIGTVLQYLTLALPLLKGVKKYITSKNKDNLVLFFLAIVVCFFVEDIILQRYTELEYTIILWSSIAYIAYCQTSTSN